MNLKWEFEHLSMRVFLYKFWKMAEVNIFDVLSKYLLMIIFLVLNLSVRIKLFCKNRRIFQKYEHEQIVDELKFD